MNGSQRPAKKENLARRRPKVTVLRFAALAAATGMLMAGCSSSGDVNTEAPDPVAAAATPSASATLVDETAAILAAYRQFFDRQTEISMAPVADRRALLEAFTTDPALSSVLTGMRSATDNGEVGYGTGTLSPRVARLAGDTATVEDCQDNSKTGQKKVKSDQITTRGTEHDFAVTTMRRGTDGAWRVSSVRYAGTSC
jgi:hypothetical protein